MPAKMYLGKDIWRGIEHSEESPLAYDFAHQTAAGFEERPVDEIINAGDAEGLHELVPLIRQGLVAHQSSEPTSHLQ